jgi:Ca-activated chloride channel family protein
VSLNRANVSIYTFSAGKKANLFLLDLLAYSNRGMSLHRETLEGFGPDLVQFVSTHSDLIVADLKYDITGDVEADLFPRRLPHLYRGETLSIYGRYPAGLEEAALSLVGRNAAGELEELVYRIDFRNAPRAPATLQVDWASQKVFHLIALNTLNPDPNLLDEVRSLAERFQLYVPYL